MTEHVPYFITGRFEGTFKLEETENGGTIKESGKRLHIYRGTIFDPVRIDQTEFEAAPFDFEGIQLHRIQADLSPHSSDGLRKYTTGPFKILNAKLSNLQEIRGGSYGIIKGDILVDVTWCAAGTPVTDIPTDEDSGGKKETWQRPDAEESNEPAGNPTSPSTDSDSNPTYPGEEGEPDGPPSPNPGPGPRPGPIPEPNPPPAPPRPPSNRKRRRFWIIVILILLCWLLFSSNWGQQWICHFQRVRIERRIQPVVKERERVEDIIARTRPKMSQCGSKQTFKGTNEPRTFTYTLGEQGGAVRILYDMYGVPDRMEVVFNGESMGSTDGFVSHTGEIVFDYTYSPYQLNELTIRIVPNQERPTTEWEFEVICPE